MSPYTVNKNLSPKSSQTCSHIHIESIYKSYIIWLLCPLQHQLHHCSSYSLLLDIFPILKWVPTVHSTDSQTSICIQITCIFNKLPGDGDAAGPWTILLSSKKLKKFFPLFLAIFYLFLRFQFKYHFLNLPQIIGNSSYMLPYTAHLHINCHIHNN